MVCVYVVSVVSVCVVSIVSVCGECEFVFLRYLTGQAHPSHYAVRFVLKACELYLQTLHKFPVSDPVKTRLQLFLHLRVTHGSFEPNTPFLFFLSVPPT